MDITQFPYYSPVYDSSFMSTGNYFGEKISDVHHYNMSRTASDRIDTLKVWCICNVINLLETCKDTPAGMVKHISLYSTGVMYFSDNNIPWITSVFHGPLTRYVKLRVVHVRGMPITFPRHQLQRKPLVSDPDMHHGTCVTHVPWCRWDR